MPLRLLPWMTTLALSTGAAACDPGSYQEGPADAAPLPSVDAPTQQQVDGGGSACEPIDENAAPDGHHFAGNACQGCHYTGMGGAPVFTLAGTLYGSSAGGAGVVGAAIIVTDANGVDHKITTGTFGNFYTRETLAYPVHVKASGCPNVLSMSEEVSGQGDCNSANCHAPDAPSGRVHLP